MANANLVFHVQLHVKPEFVEEWKTLVTAVIEAMSHEEAFVACYMDQSTADEDLFTLYEIWSEPSLDAFIQNQMSKEYRKHYEERLPTLLKSPRTASISHSVREWHT